MTGEILVVAPTGRGRRFAGMSQDRSFPFAGAMRGLGAFIGLASAIVGLADSSVVVALNTLGLIVGPGLMLGIVAVLCAIGFFAFGRPLDQEERDPNVLTFLGGASLVAGALLLAMLRQLMQPAKQTCPECANSVLATARKCQSCGYRFTPERPEG
jgi:hypothetical protein